MSEQVTSVSTASATAGPPQDARLGRRHPPLAAHVLTGLLLAALSACGQKGALVLPPPPSSAAAVAAPAASAAVSRPAPARTP